MSETLIAETPQLDGQGSQHSAARSIKSFLWGKFRLAAQKIVGHYSQASEASARFMLEHFKALKTLDAETKDRLSAEVAAYRKQLMARVALIEGGRIFSSCALVALGVLCFIVGFGLPLLFNLKYSISDSSSAWLILLAVLLYVVFFVIFIFPSLLNTNSVRVLFIWHFTVSLVYVVLLFSHVLFPSGQSSPGLIPFSIGIALLGNICFELWYFFFVTVFIVFGRIAVERWFTVRYPLAILVCNLIDVLFSVEEDLAAKQHPTENRHSLSIDLKAKQKQLSGLEIAARCVQWYLPQRLSGGDIDTNTWWKEITREAANALHVKKRWILTPKEDTHYWLSRSLASTLICILDGNWDGLEKMKSEDAVSLHLWPSRLWHALGLIVEAILPFAAFMIIQHFITLSTQVRDFAIVGLLIWALITFAGSLDPKFSDKIEAINELNPFGRK